MNVKNPPKQDLNTVLLTEVELKEQQITSEWQEVMLLHIIHATVFWGSLSVKHEVVSCNYENFLSGSAAEFSAACVSPEEAMEVDPAFLISKRGLLKVAEMVVLFVAFVCFAVAARPPYIAATCVEFIITLALLLLYLLKLNKLFTFIFWPLIDVFNSFFSAVFMCIISIIAVSTYTVKGTQVGGIVCFVAAGLWCVDGYYLFRKITFNQPRGAPS